MIQLAIVDTFQMPSLFRGRKGVLLVLDTKGRTRPQLGEVLHYRGQKIQIEGVIFQAFRHTPDYCTVAVRWEARWLEVGMKLSLDRPIDE